MSLPGAGAASSFSSEAALLPPSQTLLSLGLYFFELSSAFAFSLESSTFFQRLAILLVTFFFG